MRLYIVVLLLISHQLLSGQTDKIKNLEALIEIHKKEDTTKVNLMNELAYKVYKSDPALGEKYCNESLQLAEKLNFYKGRAYGLWIKGLLNYKNNREQALSFFEEAEKIAEVIKDTPNRPMYLMAIGNIKTTLGNSDEGIIYHRKALDLAESVNNKVMIAKCRVNIALYNASKGNITEAVTEFNKIIRNAEEINDSSLLIVTYSNLATINCRAGNFQKGMEYYYKALEVNKKMNDINSYILCLINIASVQAEHKDRDAAMKTINEALKLAKKHNNIAHMSLCYLVLGNLHILSNQPKALEYYHTALSYKSLSASQNVTVYMRMGDIYTDIHDFKNAELYFQKALQIAESNKYNRLLSEINRRYSQFFQAKKEYNTALLYAEKALSSAISSESPQNKEEALKQLSDINEELGNSQKALALYKEHTNIRDSIFNDNSSRKIALIESDFAFSQEREKYESDKAANDILLKKHKQINYLLFSISLLTVILGGILFHWYKLKKKLLIIELENKNSELENKRKTMAMAQLKLVKTSERDNQTVSSLEKIIENSDGDEKRNISRLINSYKYESINTNWKEFETYFIELNSEFYTNLTETFPDLTPNERKLCIFMKLNMTNKDIAQITYQSEEALKKSRLRLRRKLNLERNTNLCTFIHNI